MEDETIILNINPLPETVQLNALYDEFTQSFEFSPIDFSSLDFKIF